MSSAEHFLDELISTTEAAEIMGVHRTTVERQIRDNDKIQKRDHLVIRGKRIGGKWVVLQSSLPVTSPLLDGTPKTGEAAA